MKIKKLGIALLLMVPLALVSCGQDASKGNTDSESKVEKAKEEAPKELTFEKGSTIKAKDYEVKIKNIKITKKIEPDKKEGFYNYYTADKGNVYVEVDTDVKNLKKEDVTVADIGSIEVDYDNGYTYNGNLIPEDETLGFNYPNITSIAPLSSKGVRWAVQIPEEASKSDKSLKIKIKIGGEEYICNYR
ncbi:MAG: hypothetical protein ACRDCB_10640 [Clostridium sp.]